MAKRKTKRSRTRRTMSAAPVRRSRRIGRARRKRGGLSELWNPSTAAAAAKSIGAGALGGFIAGGAHKMISNQQPLTRYALGAGASFITYALLGYPMMSAGMAGAFTALESEKLYNGLLNENGDMYADPDAINQLPVMMNENGDVVTLAQNAAGEMVYLNEATGDVTLAEDVYLNEDVFLNEDGDATIYPMYSNEY